MKKLFIVILIALVILTGCGKKEKIIIYSSDEEAVDQAFAEKFKEKFPNLDIVMQYYSTGNNAAKIKSEGVSTEADIVIGLETAHMEGLKDNFETLDYIDKSNYRDKVNPEHNKYIIDIIYHAAIIVDTDYFAKHNLEYPKTYEDLLKNEYKGLIAMPNPKTSGTGYMFFLNAINVMGKNEAIKYFDKLEKNIFQFTASGSGPLSLLKQGEVPMAIGLAYQAVVEKNNGAHIDLIELETGAPYNSTGASIIKGKATDNVKKVFQYYTNELVKYESENFTPSNMLIKQDIKIKNYPKFKKNADMIGINDTKLKEEYIKLWKY